MAGGKETPRQKLIGLMYLVLLAMLALQVSSSVVDKFAVLNQSLEASYAEAFQTNGQRLKGIEDAVKDDARDKNKAILVKAQEVRDITQKIKGEIEAIKTELKTVTDNSYKDEDGTARFMVGPGDKPTGKGYQLQKDLNAYIKKLESYSPSNIKLPLLALDADEDPIFNSSAGDLHKGKDFAEVNFEHTPMVAALATLSDKQLRIAQAESEILSELAAQVGADVPKFDVINSMVRAESKYVAAGTMYKAEMFLTASSSAITPKMSAPGLKGVKNGIGQIEFKASAADYDEAGNAKKTWNGTITLNIAGRDSVFKVSADYVVVRPTISVQSAALSSLYNNCANPLVIQVPALGSAYNPTFGISGASLNKGSKPGEVTVVPNGVGKDRVNIVVSNDGAEIGRLKFNVKPIPLPSMKLLANGKDIDKKLGIDASGFPSVISVIPVPDANFKETNPADAKYKISSGEILLARGTTPVMRQKITSNSVDVSNMRAKARAGDRLVIEVSEVKRTNFRGSEEEVEGASDVYQIPIN